MVKPPSMLKLTPKLAVNVAINMVNAIREAPTLVSSPKNTKKAPDTSAPLARNAMVSGIGKCNSLPNQFSKKALSPG